MQGQASCAELACLLQPFGDIAWHPCDEDAECSTGDPVNPANLASDELVSLAGISIDANNLYADISSAEGSCIFGEGEDDNSKGDGKQRVQEHMRSLLLLLPGLTRLTALSVCWSARGNLSTASDAAAAAFATATEQMPTLRVRFLLQATPFPTMSAAAGHASR